jgi:hypothetical protein
VPAASDNSVRAPPQGRLARAAPVR